MMICCEKKIQVAVNAWTRCRITPSQHVKCPHDQLTWQHVKYRQLEIKSISSYMCIRITQRYSKIGEWLRCNVEYKYMYFNRKVFSQIPGGLKTSNTKISGISVMAPFFMFTECFSSIDVDGVGFLCLDDVLDAVQGFFTKASPSYYNNIFGPIDHHTNGT